MHSTQQQTKSQTSERYDWTTIVLHWTTAALVIIQFGTAKIWPLFEGDELETDLFNVHLTLGILLSLVIVWRLIWRLFFGDKQPVPLPRVQHILAKAVHGMLYVLLIGQVAIGYLIGWASGQPITLVGAPAIPAVIIVSRETGHLLEELHGDIAWILIAVAGLHAAAALLHHYVIRDGVLLSMLGCRPSQSKLRAGSRT